MPMPAAVDELIAKAAQDSSVLAVLIFGSAAHGESGPASDVDICLVLHPELPREIALSEKRLEYLSEFDLDVLVFQQLPLHVRRRVLREGRVLLSKDDDALYRLAARTAQAFEDFRPAYQRYLDAVLHGGP